MAYAPGGVLGVSKLVKVGGGTTKEHLLIKELCLQCFTYLFFGFPGCDFLHLFLPSPRSFFVLLVESKKNPKVQR